VRRWFASLSLHRKLTALALGVSAAGLIAAVGGLALVDIARFRNLAVDDARALAEVIAQNTSAAIVFNDAEAAATTLSSLRVRPTIMLGCVYDATGSLLASYAPGGANCPAFPRDVRTWDSVTAVVPVEQNGRTVGRVFVERDLSDLGARIAAAAGTGLVMLLLGAAVALWLARSLQHLVSKPIVDLAAAARRIGAERRFEMPDIAAPPDETGELVTAFGEMVRRVGEANQALVDTNVKLRAEIEERRRMQEEREALLAREREASRLKDEFLATLSHELRTPLNAILGWTQILLTTHPAEQTSSRGVASIARNAGAQLRVIEDLLDVSRIITGKLQLAMTQIDLRDVVDASIDVVSATATSRQIELRAVLPDTPCIVAGDYDRLRQVVWNLLSNALKFTSPGGQVVVRIVEAERAYALTVTDTGIGIADAFLPHVFERFRQADGSTTRQQGGLGLGLAIVKELAELHGGRVGASSPGLGGGATFTVWLPRSVPRGDSTPAPVESVPDLPRLDGVDLLVADDNRDALDVLAMALERAGARVRTAAGGEEAIREWERQPATVLLCDLAMPGVDGFEVLRRIRVIDAAAGRSTHAIAVTAYASDGYRGRCTQAGFAAHIAKPYNIVDVVRAVAAAAAQS
jgi:signal transduction histidine kinase/CheY-like chemotaxis protein